MDALLLFLGRCEQVSLYLRSLTTDQRKASIVNQCIAWSDLQIRGVSEAALSLVRTATLRLPTQFLAALPSYPSSQLL